MNDIPVWIWWALGGAALYAAGAFVLLGLSFGWRRQVRELHSTVKLAAALRTDMLALAEQQLARSEAVVQGLIRLNQQIVDSVIKGVLGAVIARILPLVLPRQWQRRGAALVPQMISYGVMFLTPRVTEVLQRQGMRPSAGAERTAGRS